MRWFIFWLLVASVPPLWSIENDEHQRVASAEKLDQRWSAEVHVLFVPSGAAAWSLGVSPRTSFEVGLWSGTVSVAMDWSQGATSGPVFQWGDLSYAVGWHSKEEPRWRWGLSGSASLERSPASPWTMGGELGASWVLDPSVVGVSWQVMAPVGASLWSVETPWLGALGLSVQEVLNDRVIQTISLEPRWALVRGRLFWSLSLGFSVGWYPDHGSLTLGGVQGTGQNWGLSGEGGLWW